MRSTSLSHYASPEVVRILNEIRNEEAQFDNDLRKSNRERVVLPVQVLIDGTTDCWSFSKDISESGICLISPRTFESNDVRNLQFRGLRYECDTMRATCSWSRRFSNSYWISGWQLDSQLDVPTILDEDLWLNIEQRNSDRERLAIPVVVHQRNDRPKIHCFSRNVSPSGVCLIGNEEPKTSDFSLLELVRSNGEKARATAECRWTRRIGQSCWISGWQFPRLARIQDFQMRFFNNVSHDDEA